MGLSLFFFLDAFASNSIKVTRYNDTTMQELPKEQIVTMVGYYNHDNSFTDLKGDQYSCMSYRVINQQINPNRLCCVNMRWSERLKSWVIFQIVFMEEDFQDSLGSE